MQAPPVQYCTTSDGVRIAYTVSGTGPPLLVATEPVVSHVQLEWGHPLFGRIYGRMAERNTLIRFDRRGVGLSQRNVPTVSLVQDIEAVVDRLSLDQFDAVGVQGSCHTIMRYVLAHPDRVRKLVLIDGFARASETPQIRALRAAGRVDFFLATEMLGAAAFGAGREENKDYGAYIRECIDADYFSASPDPDDREWARADTSELVSQIKIPTLVIRHTGLQYITAEMTRDLAARLPNSQYVEVEGGFADDPEEVFAAGEAFLHGEQARPSRPTGAPRSDDSGVRTILFTDIESHTAMMQRLGDERGRALLRDHESITRDVIARHGGSEIKTIGDAFMVSFASVAAAAQCAVELQQAFATSQLTEDLRIRVGLNAGEPIAEEGDLFGSSVILASRIAAKASGGEILVSDTVRGLLSGKPFLFSDRGETALRGFEDPVRLYELRWQGEPAG